MAQDKQKTRKAILGELESIKSLLEGSIAEGTELKAAESKAAQANQSEEPPLLTNSVSQSLSTAQNNDQDIEAFDDETPLLTEALNNVIEDIHREEAAKQQEFEELESEELFDDNTDISVLDSLDDDDMAFADIPTLDSPASENAPEKSQEIPPLDSLSAETASSDIPTLSPLAETESTAEPDTITTPERSIDKSSASAFERTVKKSRRSVEEDELFDSVIAHSSKSLFEDSDAASATSDDDEEAANTVSTIESAEPQPDDTDETEQHRLQEDEERVEAKQELPSQNNVSQSDIAAVLAAEKIAAQKLASREAAMSKHKPKYSMDGRSQVSDANSLRREEQRSLFADHDRTAKNAESNAVKSENPFLPKHIRDRLQSNRNATDFEKSRANLSPTSATSTPENQSTQATNSSPEQHSGTEEDKLVEELVQSFMPKIETELRNKIRALLQKQEPDEKS